MEMSNWLALNSHLRKKRTLRTRRFITCWVGFTQLWGNSSLPTSISLPFPKSRVTNLRAREGNEVFLGSGRNVVCLQPNRLRASHKNYLRFTSLFHSALD